MVTRHYDCEDCGHGFDEILTEIEDSPLACPACGGLDLQEHDVPSVDAA